LRRRRRIPLHAAPFGTVAALGVAWLASAQPPAPATPAGQEGAIVQLANRRVAPGQGIDPVLTRRLTEATGVTECLVQLERLPLPAERAELAGRGIELLEFAGGSTYFARIAAGARLDEVGLLRWAGPVLPEDKIAPSLWQRLRQPAAAPTSPLTVRVGFEEDTPREEAQRTLEKHARAVRAREPHPSWSVSIEAAAILDLAAEPRVRWIEAGPPPGLLPLSP
jgi:hypothetical protein